MNANLKKTNAARRLATTTAGRRGVTLVEMLVVVALLVLMMTVIVQIFQSATGAVSVAQTNSKLDDELKRFESTMRSDLEGVTASLTPPNNPEYNTGYLEYSENAFADLQGEDCDDTLRFTARAPAGRPFVGRMWVGPVQYSTTASINVTNQPILVTSQTAEIIYFLRNGNLYRRVLLVVPERQSALTQGGADLVYPRSSLFGSTSAGNIRSVTWQGLNDVSAHPNPVGAGTAMPIVLLNTLGDLSNRENRAFSPRFCSDFLTYFPNLYVTLASVSRPSDGVPDDVNYYTGGGGSVIAPDGIPDCHPVLNPSTVFGANVQFGSTVPLLNEPPNLLADRTATSGAPPYDIYPFPYIYPHSYSVPDPFTLQYGWIHTPNPGQNPTTLAGAIVMNHNPLDTGDNLPPPVDASGNLHPSTWWGFPTWRETMHLGWFDPAWQIPRLYTQPRGLSPENPSVAPSDQLTNPNYPTPLTDPGLPGGYQLYNDGAGASSFMQWASNPAMYNAVWQDDLIMTGVRSFDIKAYDDAFPGYVDLGWADDPTLPQNANPGVCLQGTPLYFTGNGTGVPALTLGTMAHEGRMPPLSYDHRLDARYPNPTYVNNGFFTAPAAGSFVAQYPNFNPNYSSNIGDDNPGVIRLRRVWDSWSTEYTRAPAHGLNPITGSPIGPPFSPPVYPSYPPPYPAPLRGLQIQIRVVDTRNEHVKTLTIHHDFTDKL